MEKNYIKIDELCRHYKVEVSFFDRLQEEGLIETYTLEETVCLDHEQISDLEKIIHLHQDLHLNIEGIDVVLNLLQKVDELKSELNATKNRLRIYEKGE